MAWLTANWFWVLFGILFIGMHLFGHGGHGGHGEHGRGEPGRRTNDGDTGATPDRSSGHQH